jgi:hypothetical protein
VSEWTPRLESTRARGRVVAGAVVPPYPMHYIHNGFHGGFAIHLTNQLSVCQTTEKNPKKNLGKITKASSASCDYRRRVACMFVDVAIIAQCH